MLPYGARPADDTKAGKAKNGKTRHLAWNVLRVPGFRWYFTGTVCSDFGTWVQNTAQVLLAYRLTHSVLAVALVTCAQFTSPLVLGPWAGVIADRFGGRKTLLCTELVSAVIAGTMSILVFTGRVDERWLIAGAIAIGLTFTFALPARNVTVRRLVPPDLTRAAFAMDSVSYNLGRGLGPPASIALIAAAGFGYAFAVNAVSFAVFTAVLIGTSKGTAEPERRSRVKDGFLIAYHDARIMIVLLMVVAVTVAADPVLVLGPALASHVFGVSTMWSGCFIAALGAGSVVGSLLPARREPSIRLAAMALCSLGLCMMCFVLAPRVQFSVVAAFAAGIMCLISNSTTRTLLAKEAGPSREASVMATWAIAWAGSKPLASLVDGTLATTIGVRWTGILLAAPTLIPILVLEFRLRRGHRTAGKDQRTASQAAVVPLMVALPRTRSRS
jgi:predicted MFS family arabinose efflux permease